MKLVTLLNRLREGELTGDPGREACQIIGNDRIPFSDQEVVRAELRRTWCA